MRLTDHSSSLEVTSNSEENQVRKHLCNRIQDMGLAP